MGALSHQFYRKKTHTNIYLHAESHHFPAQKTRVLNTPVTCAIRVLDDEHLEQELITFLMSLERMDIRRELYPKR